MPWQRATDFRNLASLLGGGGGLLIQVKGFWSEELDHSPTRPNCSALPHSLPPSLPSHSSPFLLLDYRVIAYEGEVFAVESGSSREVSHPPEFREMVSVLRVTDAPLEAAYLDPFHSSWELFLLIPHPLFLNKGEIFHEGP